ncbi:hypothetical protein [Abyssisolibacter fermentans]|nr:hypothetical protein [Abyssisolibacter fermentans]
MYTIIGGILTSLGIILWLINMFDSFKLHNNTSIDVSNSLHI